MDCAGTCNNFQSPDVSSEYGSTMQTFYQDSDSDGLGDPSSTVTRCSNDGPPSGYVVNSNDPEPSCSTNDTDCNGVCGGSAYNDPNYGSDSCTSNQCIGGSTGNVACVQDCSGDWGLSLIHI